jgi:hypothetical protein
VTSWAVVAAYNPVLVECRKQVLRSALERTAKEVVDPIVVDHKVAAEAVHSTKVVAAPIVVVHMAAEVAHRVVAVDRRAIVVADSDLAAAAGLDHKT